MPRATLPALVALLAAGCGGGTSSPDAGDVVNCQSDPRVTTYSPNMSVKSSGNSMTFTLVSSTPAPPARGNDTWAMHVTDAAGTPLSSLSLTVQTLMPDHGHGSPVNPTVTANGGGNYTVDPLYLFMPGVWRIRFLSAGSNETTDFWLCVQG